MTSDAPDPARTEGYVDLYLLPVPRERLEQYRAQATAFGEVVREHGGLAYREFAGDDLSDGFSVAEGMVLTAAVAEFGSRADRDAVMAKVMSDPRVTAMEREPIADMSAMRYGGFETFVRA